MKKRVWITGRDEFSSAILCRSASSSFIPFNSSGICHPNFSAGFVGITKNSKENCVIVSDGGDGVDGRCDGHDGVRDDVRRHLIYETVVVENSQNSGLRRPGCDGGETDDGRRRIHRLHSGFQYEQQARIAPRCPPDCGQPLGWYVGPDERGHYAPQNAATAAADVLQPREHGQLWRHYDTLRLARIDVRR